MQSPAPLLPGSRPGQPSISGKTASPAALAVFPPHLPSEGCQRFQTLRLMVGIARQPALGLPWSMQLQPFRKRWAE